LPQVRKPAYPANTVFSTLISRNPQSLRYQFWPSKAKPAILSLHAEAFVQHEERGYVFVSWQVDVPTDYRLLPLCAKRFVLADKDLRLRQQSCLCRQDAHR